MNNLESQIRVNRVQTLLSKQPALRSRFKGDKVVVRTRTGEPKRYHPAAVRVTQLLAKKGIDAWRCPSDLVLAEAVMLDPYMWADSH